MSSFYSFDRKLEGIRVKAKDARGWFTSFERSYEEINRKAVEQMAKWAAEELDRHVRRRNQPDSGTLRDAILDPGSHYADRDGFEFLLTHVMDERVVNPERPDRGTYWRAIEYGSWHSVGWILPISFFGPDGSGRGPNPRRAGKRLRQPQYGLPARAFVGGKDAFEKHQGGWVKIKKPIRPYHYAAFAEEKFLAGDLAYYHRLVEAELARLRAMPVGRLELK